MEILHIHDVIKTSYHCFTRTLQVVGKDKPHPAEVPLEQKKNKKMEELDEMAEKMDDIEAMPLAAKKKVWQLVHAIRQNINHCKLLEASSAISQSCLWESKLQLIQIARSHLTHKCKEKGLQCVHLSNIVWLQKSQLLQDVPTFYTSFKDRLCQSAV